MDTSPSTNFCCQCKHLLGKRHDIGNVDAWRCYHPDNIRHKRYNLVTGVPITIYMMEELESIRANSALCGPTGAWFEQYIPPVYTSGAVTLPNGQELRKQEAPAKVLTAGLKARLGALKAEDL